MRTFTATYIALADYIKLHLPQSFAHIDLWYRQIDFPEMEQVLAYPALFMDFAATPQNIGNLEQEITLQVTFYVATQSLSETRHGNTPTTIAQAQHALGLSEDLFALLHGADVPQVAGTLVRTGFAPYTAETGLLCYTTTFACNMVDMAAADYQRPTEAVDLSSRQIVVNKQRPAAQPGTTEQAWFMLP